MSTSNSFGHFSTFALGCWLGICSGVIVIGFWPSYFGVAGNVPWQFHAHGMAASLWVLMVTVQSWTAHRKPHLPIHRAVGMASLVWLAPYPSPAARRVALLAGAASWALAIAGAFSATVLDQLV